MVEVVGVEPTSEKRVSKASTCVSFYSVLVIRAMEEGQPSAVTSLALYQDASQGDPHPLIHFSVVLKSAANQGSQQHVTYLF